jgi:hypothetical protein
MVALTFRWMELIYKPQLLAITLVLVIALGLLLQGMDLPSSLLSRSPLSLIQNAFGDPGGKIIFSVTDSSFAHSIV